VVFGNAKAKCGDLSTSLRFGRDDGFSGGEQRTDNGNCNRRSFDFGGKSAAFAQDDNFVAFQETVNGNGD
jgi:hypothetical protein